jgi:D-citramalate synthase
MFLQTAGIHADGDNKNNLYFNDLLPERFGRKRKYALGKTSGRLISKKSSRVRIKTKCGRSKISYPKNY